MTREVAIGGVKIGGGRPLVLVAGPCVIENESATMRCAERLMTICNGVGMPLIFKASYDKANRTSVTAFSGPGMKEGLRILAKVKEALGVPVLSDIHSIEQVAPAADVLDVLQIPAFLCRQTDLLVAAAKTGRVVNVKKGQFLAPWDMKNVGIIFQNYLLFNSSTIFKNLEIGLEHLNRRLNGAERKEIIKDYAQKFDLQDHLQKYPSQLSGGQKQRVSIIQQVLTGTVYFQSMNHFRLDVVMTDKVINLLIKVANWHELNTLIIVSHDIVNALAISDTAFILACKKV